MEKANVLFLCTGNSARSQMAEALLRARAGDRFETYSAGLEPTEVNALAIAAMSEIGIDISGQRAKGIEEYLGRRHFGYLITVCDHAAKNCPMFPGVATRLHWSLVDPAAAEGSEEERLEVFRRVRDELSRLIDEFAETH
ncbi:MAG: arsenate reductase ArsC [Thermoleophilia bacterium]|jgi:arsenate reductase|nr:arsenate reductase ArsC [Thermoleophilia bacterium]